LPENVKDAALLGRPAGYKNSRMLESIQIRGELPFFLMLFNDAV